jgi:hypothetical protein
MGNPPGKDKSYGDAINWEILLQYIPKGEDLYIVSSDKDYRSVIDDSCIKSFLNDEWIKKKESNVYFFTSLTSFLNNHISSIKLKTEEEKDKAINLLQHSDSYQSTHKAIDDLNRFDDWSNSQIKEILKIADENSEADKVELYKKNIDYYKKLLGIK